MPYADYARRYIAQAPLALALERAYECDILSRQVFERPILDIGCGDGIFASVLSRGVIDTGIDIDPRLLDNARRSGAYADVFQCDATRIPKPDGHYRTIIANSVFEHIVPLRDVLKEAHRVLAHDGRMYLTVPTDRLERFTVGYKIWSLIGLGDLSRRSFNRFWKHHHVHDVDGWERFFASCGWQVSQAQEYAQASACMLHDALVPLSGMSFVARCTVNRWFFFPWIRRAYAPLLAPIIPVPVKGEGGLVFFELRKSPV